MNELQTDVQNGAVQPIRDIFSLIPRSWDGALKFAEVIANSDLAPKDYKGKPSNVLVAIQLGAEVGLPPMQALQSIAVINGRPSIWGDGMLGIVQGSGKLEYITEFMKDDTAYCEVKRLGYPKPCTVTFSKQDAEKAGLWGSNNWTKYPKRMLQMRARGFALRDQFSDVLKGIHAAEETIDITPHEPQSEEVRIPEPPIVTQEEKGKSIRKKIQAVAETAINAPLPDNNTKPKEQISDSQWFDTLSWMKETNEREGLMETVKKKIGVKLMASVLLQDREAFVLTYKDHAKKAGVDVGGL